MQGFLVTVEGDYFGTPRAGDRKKEKFPYKVQVKVPKPEGALSLIKNKLLDKVLRRNHLNYHAYRTHQLTSITNLDGSKVFGLTDPRMMDFNDLAEYVQRKRLPLKLELYTDLGYFRTMVYLAETNQKEFKIKQAQLERDVDEDKALAELNPELSQPLVPSESKKLKQRSEGASKNIAAVQDKTTIIQGESPSGDGVISAPASNMITEERPVLQKADKVYVEGKGYVDSKDFKEDFNKPEEKEYEVFDPTKTPSEGYGEEIQAETSDPGETEGADLVGEL